jgi:beta-galactosidase
MRFRASDIGARRSTWLAWALLAAVTGAPAPQARAQSLPKPPRLLLPADADWRFARGDFATAAMPAFDDTKWTRVDLPHDWSADGPFSADLGSGNGYAPGGIAWYRKHLKLTADLANKIAALEFDGVYDDSEVWVNGHFVGGRPYGYSSFEVTLSPHLKFDGTDNVVAVRVDHSRFADSRWYTGSGIYRHVRLRFSGPLRVAHWGTSVTTPVVAGTSATVKIDTTINAFDDGASGTPFLLESEIVLRGNVVGRVTTPGNVDRGRQTVTQNIDVARPELWFTDSPTLYTVRQRVIGLTPAAGNSRMFTREDPPITDIVETTFGIRTIRFDGDRGFFLNDQPMKLKGVCVHQDAGSVGVAVPEAVWERRLRALKDLGVNAIRTSHNPPAPEFLDLCDRLGLLVKDEAFDEFTPTKNKWVSGWNAGVPSRFGYGEVFAEWSVRDAEDMVKRDRNHPSIVMWSIGNEVDYPNDPFSHPVLERSYRPTNPPAENLVTLARPLIAAVKTLDPTRPVTMALASVLMSDAVGLGTKLDIVGYNYQESRYAADHAKYPPRVIFGSENSHSYDNWAIVRDNPYVAGQFLWTGIDYLGEARTFPNRANGAGLLDLAGFKKPAAWFRQSLWSDKPMVYLAAAPALSNEGGAPARPVAPAEHWNWQAGSTMTVSAYTNTAEVDLTLNGQSLGTKRLADARAGVLSWTVPYDPGVLKAVATTNGRPVADFTLRTAGAATRIALTRDSSAVLAADSRQTAQIEFRIVDDAGVRVPNADALVTFQIDGPAKILGIGNGDLNNIEVTKDAHRTYQGRGLLILRITDSAATVTVKASSPGLETAVMTLVPPAGVAK